ncbi:M67 family metallopeptidase [Paenibacillus sp. IB182496]|uniref:M67 family metallopeptidase n=1 Tax=Paenibacillus sabuli TaxID=2772509 RepID=A0A927BV57_9BACL|nr:M67 family metallopeptidase [Paenibacillus sabuli]MBD2846054.1 M67 family metallopeptidase [Paenibacillus sabuli]
MRHANEWNAALEPVRIAATAYADMLEQCRAALPYEACGLLAASGSHGEAPGLIDRALPVRNCSRTPQTAFRFAPEDWIRQTYAIRSQGWQLVGLYHSHPLAAPRPSTADWLGWPEAGSLTCWIIGPSADEAPEARVYRRGPNAFEPIPFAVAR